MTHEIHPLIPVPKLSVKDQERIYKKLMEEKPKPVANIQNGFYMIDLQLILQSTTPEYRSFLRDAGYGDLDACSHLDIAKNMLRIDQDVRDAAARNGITLTGKDNDYVIDINQTNARKIVEAMGYKLLTVALMYKLFIPYIEDLAHQGNEEAQVTLDEMVNTQAEWLEDLILDKNKVKIGTKEKTIMLPQTDGYFDITDINQFGYPTAVRDSGEFPYWFPRRNREAAICVSNSGRCLNLDMEPFLSSFFGKWLWVRLAKLKC
ncbi:hypothetical protein HYX19_00570 [Candidatus Woesearchaeota archaeon]|nr:hypothetical protein [Candidatus Woesearchaeota archaeon]